MTLTIELAPEVERHLTELADDLGIPLELYADHLLTEKVLSSRMQPRMLVFDKADGSSVAVPFRLLYRFTYRVTDGQPQMIFYYPGGTIMVEGPDLRQLLDDYL